MTLSELLLYLGGAALVVWGAAHVAPTSTAARSFGAIGANNCRILVMEWVAEGVTLISMGALVILVAAAGGSGRRAPFR
jgi:hypothetical protein